jgi:hypothetical protein
MLGPYEIEVFRSGKHTDSAGNVKEWSDTDLDSIVSKYDPTNFKAPVVIGHPKDNSPAFGWVDSVKRKGKTLLASVQLLPEFVESVKDGLYKNRSISLYPDLSLRHIGFLGAMPPAVKGLAEVQFNEGEATTFEFTSQNTAYELNSIGRMFSRLREWIIEKFGLDTADSVISTWDIDSLKTAKAEITNENTLAGNGFAEGDSDMKELETANAKIAELEGKITQFSQDVTAKDQAIVTLTNKVSELEKSTRLKSHADFCDKLIAEGKMLPAMREIMIEQIELAQSASSGEFSEGQRPVDKLKKSLEASPKIVQFGEMNPGQGAQEEMSASEIAQKATEFQDAEAKSGRTVSIAEAVNHVSKKG